MADQSHNGKNHDGDSNTSGKRPYEPPKLTSYGTMEELTGIRKTPGALDAWGSRFIR